MYLLTKVKEKANNFKPYAAYLAFGIFLLIFRTFQGKIVGDLFDAVIYTSIYAIAGLGFALLLGYGGLASLGTGAFIGIGIFGLHYLYKYVGTSVLIAIAIVIIISIVISIVFGFVSLRISGLYLAIVTLGLSQIVIEIIKNIGFTYITTDSFTGQEIINKIRPYSAGTTTGFRVFPNIRPLQIFNQDVNGQIAIVFIAIFIFLAMVIVRNLMFSPTGRALLAVKNSQTAAQTMGVDVVKYRLLAFLVSGVYGTVAGILVMLYTRAGSTNNIDLSFALNILAAVIIGGTKSIWGIFIGTFIIFGLDLAILNRLQIGSFTYVLSGFLIVIMVMFYPGGIFQIVGDIKNKIKGWREKRRVRIYGENE